MHPRRDDHQEASFPRKVDSSPAGAGHVRHTQAFFGRWLFDESSRALPNWHLLTRSLFRYRRRVPRQLRFGAGDEQRRGTPQLGLPRPRSWAREPPAHLEAVGFQPRQTAHSKRCAQTPFPLEVTMFISNRGRPRFGEMMKWFSVEHLPLSLGKKARH